jgi:predicted GNAT superfamily acetyltransferase
MHTTDRFGGLTLGAFVDGRLVGYSYALPGFAGRPFLLSCGLAVAREFESRGVGLSLKLAQARHARGAGYELIRWTTNALASRPLRLYLSKLGARLVRYHQEMYGEVQGALFPDEVEVEWDIRDGGPAVPAHGGEPPPRLDRTGLTSLTLPSYSVEIPWDHAALEREAGEVGREWLMDVRTSMRALLAAGYLGTAVIVDPPTRRSFVRFDRAGPA